MKRVPILGNFIKEINIQKVQHQLERLRTIINKQNPTFTHLLTTDPLSIYMNIINDFSKKNQIITMDNYGQYIPINRIFYRGENQNFSHPNIASAFRNKFSESSAYHVYMKRFYSTFKNMNNFSKLTYMQHFGIPTRLLDITSNALVALFFACWPITKSLNKKSGAVYIILPKASKNNKKFYTIYNNYSDTVEIFSTLALLKDVTKNKIFQKINNFNKKIISHNTKEYKIFYYRIYIKGKWSKNYSKNKELIKDLINKKHIDIKSILNLGKNYLKQYHTYALSNFMHKIRQDVGDFKPDINFKNFSRPIIVSPAINNKRIEAQHGCFIFENFQHTINTPKIIEKHLNKTFNIIKIIIPGKDKKTILKDMDRSYGINSATLFPDYENVSKYIKHKYQKATN